MTPTRIQLSRKKGWRLPDNTIKVDRSTKWGNPYIVGKHGTRAECVELFIHLVNGRICLTTQLRDLRAMSLTAARKQGQDATALAGHKSASMTDRYLRDREVPVVRGPAQRRSK